VAVEGSEIIGHVAFSPARAGSDGEGWFWLGAISVRPDRQRGGIGSALVIEGLSILRARGAEGCVLIGEPAYYGRFGFVSDGSLSYREVPAAYVQALASGEARAAGELVFAPAFER